MEQDIPRGFQLHITSWENDAAYVKTKIFSGLSEEDVKFLLEVAWHFSPVNNQKKGRQGYPNLGNGNVPEERLVRIIEKAHQKFQNTSDRIKSIWALPPLALPPENDNTAEREKQAGEAIDSLLGVMEVASYRDKSDEGHECRALDHAKVYFLPAKLEDMTREFHV